MADENGAPTPPLSIRWIWHLRDVLQRSGRRVAVGLVFLGLAVVLARGVYTVDNGESAALLRFGALVDDSVQPGLRFRFPLGVDEVIEKRTGEIFRVEIVSDRASMSSLVTGDENFVVIATTVQYRILRLGQTLFSTDDALAVIEQAISSELLEAAAGLGVDDLLTSAKAGVQQQVQLRSQERFDAYDLGIGLVSVNLQAVDPPREAEAAFRAVLDARSDSARGVSEAHSRADRSLRLARGSAAKVVAEAESAADRRLQQARGAALRFRDLLEQKRRSPELTRADLYARSIQKALRPTRMVLLPPGKTERLDFNLIDP